MECLAARPQCVATRWQRARVRDASRSVEHGVARAGRRGLGLERGGPSPIERPAGVEQPPAARREHGQADTVARRAELESFRHQNSLVRNVERRERFEHAVA